MEKYCQKRIITDTLSHNKTATSNRMTHHATPASRKPVSTRLVGHCNATCRQRATRHRLQRRLHLQHFSIRKNGRTVALTTTTNTYQPETRLQCRQTSIHSINHANMAETTEENSIVRVTKQVISKPRTEHKVKVISTACRLRKIEPPNLVKKSKRHLSSSSNHGHQIYPFFRRI